MVSLSTDFYRASCGVEEFSDRGDSNEIDMASIQSATPDHICGIHTRRRRSLRRCNPPSTYWYTPISHFTRDPLRIAEAPLYYGIVSNIGILFWCTSAVICLFTSAILCKSNDKGLSSFFPDFRSHNVRSVIG